MFLIITHPPTLNPTLNPSYHHLPSLPVVSLLSLSFSFAYPWSYQLGVKQLAVCRPLEATLRLLLLARAYAAADLAAKATAGAAEPLASSAAVAAADAYVFSSSLRAVLIVAGFSSSEHVPGVRCVLHYIWHVLEGTVRLPSPPTSSSSEAPSPPLQASRFSPRSWGHAQGAHHCSCNHAKAHGSRRHV
jgi:hypothetical protein